MKVHCDGIQVVNAKIHGVPYALPDRAPHFSTVPRPPGHRETDYIEVE